MISLSFNRWKSIYRRCTSHCNLWEASRILQKKVGYQYSYNM